MSFNTWIPIIFAVGYLTYIVFASKSAKKNGGSYEYRPAWILISLLVIGLCIYALVTGQSITNFLG